MTKENMKKLYDHFIKTGQTERAKEILKIERYKDFDKEISVEEPKKKKEK